MRRLRGPCADEPVVAAVGHRSVLRVELHEQHPLREDVRFEKVVEGGAPLPDDGTVEVGCEERSG
jgi:hypothetical protein